LSLTCRTTSGRKPDVFLRAARPHLAVSRASCRQISPRLRTWSPDPVVPCAADGASRVRGDLKQTAPPDDHNPTFGSYTIDRSLPRGLIAVCAVRCDDCRESATPSTCVPVTKSEFSFPNSDLMVLDNFVPRS
jgi:hypothetical protein